MNHQQFCQSNIGTFVERRTPWPGFRNQCVDLALAYAVDVWGVTLSDIPGGNAIAWADGKHIPERFGKWVENTATAVPTQGALIVFALGETGHIAVVDSADTRTVTVIEQNGGGSADTGEALTPIDRVKNCVRRFERNYTHWQVKGWYERNVSNLNLAFPVYYRGRPLRRIPIAQIKFDRPLNQMHPSRLEALEFGYRRGGSRVKLVTIIDDPRWSGHTVDPIRLYFDNKSGRYLIENGYHRVFLARKYHFNWVLAIVTP